MSCGAESGSSGGASGGPGDEKDKDMDSSHRVNELEDTEYPEADTLVTHCSAEADDLSHSAASTSSQKDSESGMRDDSDSEGETSIPRSSSRRAKDNGRNKKNTGRYFTDCSYLNSLSKQERRRIEGEIIKGRKLALTVNNIVQELRGVDLFKIEYGKTILGIPRAQLAELQSAHHSTDEQEAAVVRYWLLRDPLASWRRIIYQLDWWADLGYGHYADRIRHYAEELTDTTLTHSNLSIVLNPVVDMNDLMWCLFIPPTVREKIREHSKDKEQQRYEFIHYYLKSTPIALCGWGFLGGELHYHRQVAALTAAKIYIPRTPEPSLTVDTLTSVLDGVQRLDDVGGVGACLQIPDSQQEKLARQYDRRQLPRAFSTVFLTDNPSPSWSTVALALWEVGEFGALEVVQKLYLKDINLQNLCLEKLSNWLNSTSDIDTLPLPAKLKVQLKHRSRGK